jgi:hypothetical protein
MFSPADAAVPPAPPPPAPRPVPPGAVSWNDRFMLLFGGIWGLVGTVITVVFTLTGGPVWNDWILDSRGVRADAKPFEVHATNNRVNRRYVNEIRFRFTDPDGQEHTGHTGTTDPALIASARKGTTMAVEYDPRDPERVRLLGGSASFFGYFALMPLGFAAVGGFLFLRGLLAARRTRATYRDGTAVTARVIAVETTASSQNRQRVMRMVYELTGPTGTVTGAWKTMTPAAQGATIWVIYDPAQPERSVPANV